MDSRTPIRENIYAAVLYPVCPVAGETAAEFRDREEARQQLVERFDPRYEG